MAAHPAGLPRISRATLAFFRLIVRVYFFAHFGEVRMQGAEKLINLRGPLIVYGNHGSWWDPMLCVLLARRFLSERKHYAPMDSVPLKRYWILRRIGIFPVELGTHRGAAQFLRTAKEILASGGVLWITPQGRFADVRERPLAFKAGISLLAQKISNVQMLPMAVEYTFWNKRFPEVLVRIGDVVCVNAEDDIANITRTLENTLETEMNELRVFSMKRDASQFEQLGAATTGKRSEEGADAHDAEARRVRGQ